MLMFIYSNRVVNRLVDSIKSFDRIAKGKMIIIM